MNKLLLILLLPLSVYSQDIDFSKTPQTSVDSLRYYMHQELNEYRLQNNVNKLELSDSLNELAQSWAKTMYDTGDFKHSNLPFAENIQYGSRHIFTLKKKAHWTLQSWKDSPGHDANLKRSYFIKVGYGFYEGYKVQIFE